jgi:hypothetical protein
MNLEENYLKSPFRKRTINLLLASTIALTPFAANLAIAPNSVHADAITFTITDVSALVQAKIYDHLSPSDIADINVVKNNIEKYSATDFTSIVGADIIQKIDAKTNGKAVILAKDISKLLFQTNSAGLTTELNAFKSAHSDIFAGKLSSNDVMLVYIAFEDNLKDRLISSLTVNNTTFDQVVTEAIQDTKIEFPALNTLYQQELGISLTELLTMKTNIEKVIDKDKIASAAFSSALIKGQGGNLNGPSTYTIGTTAPSYSLTVNIDFLGGPVDISAITNNLVWKTNNSTIAAMTGNKLVAKKAGKVKVVAAYLGQPIMTKEVTINPDITAPAAPVVNAFSNKDLVILGKAEVNSFITIKNGSATVGTGYTSSKGVFSISLKNTLKAGTTLTVTAKDAAGNVSKTQTVTVLDKIAPTTPTVYTVDNNDTSIKGKAEAGSTITVKNGSSTVATGKTASNGSFSLNMKAQKAGSTLSVTAKDAAGNVSSARVIKVIDKTAPASPAVSTVDNNDTVIKGKAEAGSTITIKNGKTTVASGKVSSNGTFSIKIKKALKAGSTLTVTAKDSAGNVSKSTSTKVALATPTVYSVDNNDKTIKGKATPYAYITIKNGKTTIAKGKTSSKGTFSIKIKKAQKAGSTITVTAKDAAGHVSKATSTKVLDRIAPAKPRVYYVDSNDKVVRGKAEPNSYITVKKGSKVLGTGKTSSKGNYSVKIKAQKKGTVISITAKDKSNNVSSKRVISIIAK